MVNCPNCRTQNEPNSRFCISCGCVLTEVRSSNPAATTNPTQVHRRYLALATGRIVIALFLIWFLRGILLSLSFVEGLFLPGTQFSIEQIITFFAYLVAISLLIGYSQTLRTYWTPAFPSLASLIPALLVVVYVILLSFGYRALLPILLVLVDDPSDIVLALRVILTVLAISLLIWAGKVIYDALPGWLGSIRFDSQAVVAGTGTCTNCGRSNPTDNQYCGYCGQVLIQTTTLIGGVESFARNE
mgnify:CR=1 FL=1